MWGKRLDLPTGFMASGAQMLTAGRAMLLAAMLRGEALAGMPSDKALWALVYLIFVGAILGFSAYVYLLATVRPALATSHAYVNPLDAMELAGLAVILGAVVLVYLPLGRRTSSTAATEA